MYSDHSELDGNPAAELGTGTAVAERKLSAVQFDGRKSVSRILDSDTNILYLFIYLFISPSNGRSQCKGGGVSQPWQEKKTK